VNLDLDIRRLTASWGTMQRLFARAELEKLPSVIWHDERLEALAGGLYSGTNGIVCRTDRRVLFVSKGILSGLKVADFPLDEISSIQYKVGLIAGELTIFSSGNRAEITQIVPKDEARLFAEGVRARGETEKEAPAGNRSTMRSQPPEPRAFHRSPILTGNNTSKKVQFVIEDPSGTSCTVMVEKEGVTLRVACSCGGIGPTVVCEHSLDLMRGEWSRIRSGSIGEAREVKEWFSEGRYGDAVEALNAAIARNASDWERGELLKELAAVLHQ
jgi:hypothetical protein